MQNFSNYLKAIAQANAIGVPSCPQALEPSQDCPDQEPFQPSGIAWIFHPGMLQDSPDKWWADFKFRKTLHEGIDICFYKTKTKLKALKPGSKVPAMAHGILLNISCDLLGHSMAVSYPYAPSVHCSDKAKNCQEYFPVLVYSHLDPNPKLKPGDKIAKGQLIGHTFDTRTIKSKLLSHLHLSCLLIPKTTPDRAMDWTLFSDREKVGYINPVFL
ncbi:MAG: hypothetical protein HUK40_17105 [Desulfobacter sp.]|nr:hypothetical protein [Desulfobacter sp.]WDP86927.1 MAG: hypothetical protein HUN05_18850 [Desulfobacter sp.]